jgi:hypothetical protein
MSRTVIGDSSVNLHNRKGTTIGDVQRAFKVERLWLLARLLGEGMCCKILVGSPWSYLPRLQIGITSCLELLVRTTEHAAQVSTRVLAKMCPFLCSPPTWTQRYSYPLYRLGITLCSAWYISV